MIFYAIRQKSTGFFLPQIPRKKGYTFTDPEDPTKVIPRFFRRKQDAQCALKYWLAGKYDAKYTGCEDYTVELVGFEVIPVPSRKSEDMEVIEVSIGVA